MIEPVVAVQVVTHRCTECGCVIAKSDEKVLTVFARHHGHSHRTVIPLPIDKKRPILLG